MSSPASSQADNSGEPKELSFEERWGIVERMLVCPSLSNPGSRDTIINSLPLQIANNVTRATQAKIDILNLLTTCLSYPHGLQALLEVLEFFEQGSIPFRELERYIGRI